MDWRTPLAAEWFAQAQAESAIRVPIKPSLVAPSS